MKTIQSILHLRRGRALLSLVVASAVVAPSAFAASNSKTSAADRPPLKLHIDTKSIDRNAPDRVSYAPIVQKSAASVVYVYSTKRVRGQDLSPFFSDPLFRRFFNVPGMENGRMPDQTQHGLGSGVVITDDGYILTNNHVVDGADDVKVSIGESSKRYDADVIGTDSLADIAVLRIKDQNLSPATLGDSDELKVGDVVLAIGDPFGVGQSVSRGIVSALGRGNLGIEAFEDFIQTDSAINPGNSGGALIDSQGRVVGINTAILSQSGGFAGVGFAIPINLARDVAEQIVKNGRVDRGFLGVAPQNLTPDLAAQFSTDHGALIAEVTPGSPAEKAGLQAGDVITKVNNSEIRDSRHLLLTVGQLAPDTEVSLEYLRNGKTHTATAKLARRPDENQLRNSSANGGNNSSKGGEGVLNGVTIADLSPQYRQQLQIPDRVQGVIVTDVDPNSASAREGLQRGDVILELDHKPVKSADDAVQLSEQIKGPKVLLRVWRQGNSMFMVVDESR